MWTELKSGNLNEYLKRKEKKKNGIGGNKSDAITGGDFASKPNWKSIGIQGTRPLENGVKPGHDHNPTGQNGNYQSRGAICAYHSSLIIK